MLASSTQDSMLVTGAVRRRRLRSTVSCRPRPWRYHCPRGRYRLAGRYEAPAACKGARRAGVSRAPSRAAYPARRCRRAKAKPRPCDRFAWRTRPRPPHATDSQPPTTERYHTARRTGSDEMKTATNLAPCQSGAPCPKRVPQGRPPSPGASAALSALGPSRMRERWIFGRPHPGRAGIRLLIPPPEDRTAGAGGAEWRAPRRPGRPGNRRPNVAWRP